MLSNHPYRPLPIEIEGITCDWLSAALSTYAPDVTVRGFKIVDMKRGTCTKIRLKLDLDEAGKRAGIPETVILKGGFETHSRDMHYMHGMEVRGYRDVLPVLKLPSPVSYFADHDVERQQGIVIMEDLVARGVTFCNPLKPQTQEMVARRLDVLAGFHAKTWNSPEFNPGGKWAWLEDVAGDQQRYFVHYLQPDVWKGFIDSPRGAAVSVKFHSRDWMQSAFDRMAKFSPTLPKAVLHCDTHLGNLYVDPDGTPGFFDSLPHRGPPMLEVAYHLVCALDTADRKRWEGALIRHYLDELGRRGVDAPLFDDALRQFGIFLAYAYGVFIVNEAFFQSEAINTAYTARISAAMIDHNTTGLLEALG